MIVALMGVAGCGKTSVGVRLARRLGASFVDADDHHPAVNVDKMRRGTPLSDADRWPWLEAVSAAVAAHRKEGAAVVIACSLLKRRYRAFLSRKLGPYRLIHLKSDALVIGERLDARRGHFMNPDLLSSQFEALEEPTGGIVVDVSMPLDKVVAEISERLAVPTTPAT